MFPCHTSHESHNVSFFIAQQSGGCDSEAWRTSIACPHHPPLEQSDPDETADTSMGSVPRSIPGNAIPPVKHYPYRVATPPELQDSMSKTIGYALDFLLGTLDYSPDEPLVPANEADLRLQPSGDPMLKDQYCVIIWNDDKHSIEEAIQLIHDSTGRPLDEARDIVLRGWT
jgi:E3 ubiquitin-protein ligase UBR1